MHEYGRASTYYIHILYGYEYEYIHAYAYKALFEYSYSHVWQTNNCFGNVTYCLPSIHPMFAIGTKDPQFNHIHPNLLELMG